MPGTGLTLNIVPERKPRGAGVQHEIQVWEISEIWNPSQLNDFLNLAQIQTNLKIEVKHSKTLIPEAKTWKQALPFAGLILKKSILHTPTCGAGNRRGTLLYSHVPQASNWSKLQLKCSQRYKTAKSSAKMFPNSIGQNDDFADEPWVGAGHLNLPYKLESQVTGGAFTINNKGEISERFQLVSRI